MKKIEVDDDLYQFIASQTQNIGESASDILRRLLKLESQLTASTKPKLPPSKKPQKPAQVPTDVPTDTSAMATKVGASSALDQEISAFLTTPEFTAEPTSIMRFLQLLSALYNAHPDSFEAACNMKGKKRSYFAKSAEALDASGKTTRPREIPNSPFWVIGNTNTGRKRIILRQVMTQMGADEATICKVCEVI